MNAPRSVAEAAPLFWYVAGGAHTLAVTFKACGRVLSIFEDLMARTRSLSRRVPRAEWLTDLDQRLELELLGSDLHPRLRTELELLRQHASGLAALELAERGS